MDNFIFWMILVALAIIIGNQTRERQDRETTGMTKKQKEKYFKDIKDKQWETKKKILTWVGAIIFAIILLMIFLLS